MSGSTTTGHVNAVYLWFDRQGVQQLEPPAVESIFFRVTLSVIPAATSNHLVALAPTLRTHDLDHQSKDALSSYLFAQSMTWKAQFPLSKSV
jgi:hypothetical protein